MTKTYTSKFSANDVVVGLNNNIQFVGRVQSIEVIPGVTSTGAQTSDDYVSFRYVVSNGSVSITRNESELKSAAQKIEEYNAQIASLEELIEEIEDA